MTFKVLLLEDIQLWDLKFHRGKIYEAYYHVLKEYYVLTHPNGNNYSLSKAKMIKLHKKIKIDND